MTTKSNDHLDDTAYVVAELFNRPGTVWPEEYDWARQFVQATSHDQPFVSVDTGKLRGLVLAYAIALMNLEDCR